MDLTEVMRSRRSIRNLTKILDFDDRMLEGILKEAMRVPSAFHMQSYRIVALSGGGHDRLWGSVEASLLAKLGEETFASTKTHEKISGFRGGNGTLLFFEDLAVVEEKGDIAKSYKDTFPDWSQQGSGIIQYAVWLQLAEQGISASLQHYHKLIEDKVREEWHIPPTWKLISQMPYGKADEIPVVREFIPFEEMVKFYYE
jgi:predicted oxidoreductase (fatty acid repression mutant protein)